jgi:hypothetical protein
MPWHQLWHVAVLGATLLAVAGVLIVSLAPLLFDLPGAVLRSARRLALAMLALAVGLVVTEWLAIHGRFL